MNRSHSLLAAIGVATMTMSPAVAQTSPAPGVTVQYGDQARDHAAIMQMAGTFKVTLDMRETTPLVTDYALSGQDKRRA